VARSRGWAAAQVRRDARRYEGFRSLRPRPGVVLDLCDDHASLSDAEVVGGIKRARTRSPMVKSCLSGIRYRSVGFRRVFGWPAPLALDDELRPYPLFWSNIALYG
jgi:hypothetical protein